MTPTSAAEILQNHLNWLNGNEDAMTNAKDRLADALDLAITTFTAPFMDSNTAEPDWSKAPWANYYAIDGDGSRWFYEFEPFQDGLDFNQNEGKWMNDDDSRRMKLFKRPEQ
jgi:hypothetical protein